MTIREIPMYQVVCDHGGCDYYTAMDGEFYAWAEESQALDEWVESENVQTPDGRHFCREHIPDDHCPVLNGAHDMADRSCTECDYEAEPVP